MVAGMPSLREDAAPVAPALAGDPVLGRPAPSLHLQLLDGFELTRGTQPVALGRGGQRLLALLAAGNRPLARSFVAFCLWPDKTERRAAGNLRSALWSTRGVDADLVGCAGAWLRLLPSLRVDLHVAAAVAQRTIAGDHPVDHRAVHRVLTADLLPDWYESWLEPERERFRQLRLHALEALSAQLLGRGDVRAAVEVGVAAVAGEPRRESSRRVLIRAHLAEGNEAEALRQYESYRYVVHSELGIMPSPQIEALVSPIRERAGAHSKSGGVR